MVAEDGDAVNWVTIVFGVVSRVDVGESLVKEALAVGPAVDDAVCALLGSEGVGRVRLEMEGRVGGGMSRFDHSV